MSIVFKKIAFIVTLVFTCTLLQAQNSSLINYQAAARRADGSGIANLTMAVKFEILQGSATGSVLTSETQTLQTNGLGLFSTQIGKGTNLNLIDWQSAIHYLKVSIDTTAGSSFVDLGTQQFVSVPYAMQSEHVPSTYTNNILSIGKNTYTLSSGPSYTSGTGIAITSGSIVNTSPDQTVSINSGTNVNVSGTYPNFTISATPSLAVTGNSLSISGGNTVTLTTTPNTSLVASGAAAVTTLGTNSYSIHVPQPTLTVNSNSISISGGNSVQLPSAPSASIVTSGAAVTTTLGVNSYSINVPQPTLSATGNSVSISGGNTVTVTTTPNTSLVASGAAAVATLGTNSYSINVPQPTLSATGNSVSISGGNTVTVTTTPNTSLVASGAAAVATLGTNSYSINVPQPSLSVSGNSILVNGANGVAIPSPTFAYSNTTGSLTSGTSSAYITPSVTFTNNILTVGPTANSVAIASGWSLLGNAGTNATSNFIGTTDNVSLNFRVNNLKSGSINPANNSLFFGYTAGQAVTTGSFNTGVGHEALYSVTSGQKNTGVGQQALRSVTSGLDNTAVGYGALFSNSVGNYNSAFGKDAMYFNTTGSQNTANGVAALLNNTNGFNNTGTGYQALSTNTTGSQNTADGAFALTANLNGSSNTALGYRALNANTVGSANTAVGTDAMLFNTSGLFNVSLGLNSLRGNTVGNSNTAIGRNALNNSTSGSFNVALGHEAGFSLTSGAGNVFLGAGAGYFETGSNKLYISNSTTSVTPLIYGDFTSGNVGISTANANAPLQFNNTIGGRKIVLWEGANNDHQVYGFGINSNILRYQVDASVANHVFYSGINSTSSLELFRITGTGSVGIRTSAPNGNFHVHSPTSSVLSRITSTAATTGLVTYIDGASSALLSYESTPMNFGVNGTNMMQLTTTGMLKLGNVTPSNANTGLVVGLNGAFDNRILITGGDNNNFYGGMISFAENLNQVAGMSLRLNAGANRLVFTNDLNGNNAVMGIGGYAGANNGVAIGTGYAYSNAPSDGMIVQGFTGIGTTAPSANLHVAGTTRLVDGTQGAGKVLTSDASGNASWATPTVPSRVRSITVIPTMFTSVNLFGGVTAVNIGGWGMPALQFPDGNSGSYARITVVMPSDWNGSGVTYKVLYSTPNTSGNIYCGIYSKGIATGQDINQGPGGIPTAIGPSGTTEYLNEATIPSGVITGGSKVIHIWLWRHGTDGNDTNTGVMNVYGIKIEYND